MQINYRQYPHPVLSYFSDDLVRCAFQTTLKTAATKTTYKFDLVAKTSNQDLNTLIKDKKAAFSIHIECPTTRFRRIYKTYEEQHSFEISSDLLDGRVQVCAFIIAGENIPNYKNSNFHSDYGNMTFKVQKGDILAVDRDRTFDAEKNIDPLKRIPSIFQVRKNNNENPTPFDLDLDSHKVVIMLSPENYEQYKFLSQAQDLQSTMSSMLILPALIELLERIKSGATGNENMEYEDLRWYRVLTNRLREFGINVEDVNSFTDSTLVIAQKLIGDPLLPSLKTLTAYNTED